MVVELLLTLKMRMMLIGDVKLIHERTMAQMMPVGVYFESVALVLLLMNLKLVILNDLVMLMDLAKMILELVIMVVVIVEVELVYDQVLAQMMMDLEKMVLESYQ